MIFLDTFWLMFLFFMLILNILSKYIGNSLFFETGFFFMMFERQKKSDILKKDIKKLKLSWKNIGQKLSFFEGFLGFWKNVILGLVWENIF